VTAALVLPGARPGPSDEELRTALQDAAEWVSGYLRSVGERPVLAQVAPGDLLAALPEHAPAAGEPLEAIMADVDRLILPGITHWNHPAFFAYFGITGSGPGIVGELLAAALNVNGMLWRTSPAATELEQRTTAWALDLLGLPPGWFGQITDSASSSTLYALAAAREAVGLDIRRRGMAGRSDLPPLRVYASAEAHSSIEKACIALGLGQEGLCKVEVDADLRMRPDILAAAVERDVAAGVRPIAVVPTVGTTSTTSVDPVPEIADIAAAYGMWMHVDAAYGGAAGLLPDRRGLLAGCERADSLVFNPHKWLLTPVDCSLLYTARPEALRAAFSLVPFYLTSSEEDVVNLMDYGLVLGRRFRALKLWFVLRAYGREGLASIIAGHVELAGRLAGWIDSAPGWERLAPVPLSTVCFRRHPDGIDDEEELDRINADLVERVNSGGTAFVSHTRVAGRFAVRVAIGNGATGEEHVRQLWSVLQERSTRPSAGRRGRARSPRPG
jgi:aromatic-L-amino-acid decarboxylase